MCTIVLFCSTLFTILPVHSYFFTLFRIVSLLTNVAVSLLSFLLIVVPVCSLLCVFAAVPVHCCVFTAVPAHCLLFLFAHCCVCSLLFLLIAIPVCSCLPLARAFFAFFQCLFILCFVLPYENKCLFNHRCFHLFILRFVLPDESKCPFQRRVLSPLYFMFCIAR